MTGPPQTEEEWRQAEALAIWRQHGEAAPLYVAERLGALALVNDAVGAQRFQQIAGALTGLMRTHRH